MATTSPEFTTSFGGSLGSSQPHWVVSSVAGSRRVIVALARGGIYSDGSPAASYEFVERYLRAAFNFIGIEPEFVLAEGLAISPEQREQSIGHALGETLRLAA